MKVEILQQNGYNFLWINGYLWMWDLPGEVEVQEDIARQAHGDVLVAGLGLGIVQRLLAKNKTVTSIETVEKYEEVRDAYFDKFKKHPAGHVIIDDFYNLPDPSYQRWDCVIGDIVPEIQPIYLPEYVKFKTHAQTLLKSGGKVLAWGADYFEFLLEEEEQEEPRRHWSQEPRGMASVVGKSPR